MKVIKPKKLDPTVIIGFPSGHIHFSPFYKWEIAQNRPKKCTISKSTFVKSTPFQVTKNAKLSFSDLFSSSKNHTKTKKSKIHQVFQKTMFLTRKTASRSCKILTNIILYHLHLTKMDWSLLICIVGQFQCNAMGLPSIIMSPLCFHGFSTCYCTKL